MKKFKPNQNRVLVELEPIKEKTVAEGKTDAGGNYKIVAPEARREQARYGLVLAVGKPAKPEDAGRFEVGDTIVIKFYIGNVIRDFDLGWNDDDHRVVAFEEILGKFVG